VLSHINHKVQIIDSSNALSAYWDYLDYAIQEVNEIILFGYSGKDTHLNKVLKQYAKDKKIKVIEWSSSGDKEEQKSFWEDELNQNNIELIHLDNILDFTQWSD
jgi:hypothetical protein